ncbi:MAG: hypothetical protein O3B01_10300 [Planctomycetota bacterium]|nr:hypothetical protein [Planctomycetota bacterium]MDA1138962.1 hypothetical protein [Planctomycetota bacterium]
MAAKKFWTLTGIGYAIVAIAYVIFVGPFHAGAARKRQELENVLQKLDQYHRRGTTIVNENWRSKAMQHIAKLQEYDTAAKEFFKIRHGEQLFPWAEWQSKTDATPAEFKLAYLSGMKKLSGLADKLIQLPESGPLQSENFENPPGTELYAKLFEELWLQSELVEVLGRAEVTELIRIRIPRPDSHPERPESLSAFPEIPFSLECRLPAASIPVLFNQLLQSVANISPDSLKITLASRNTNNAIMHLNLTARAIPENYLN